MIVVNMFMIGILFGFLPVYVNSLGYDQLKNGFIVAASTTSYLLIQPVAGLLADRFGPTQVTIAGLGVSAIAITLVPFTTGALLLSAAILGGVGVGTVWTNTDTAVSNLAKEGRIAGTLARIIQVFKDAKSLFVIKNCCSRSFPVTREAFA